ncbi:MAG: DsrE family protein [Desulfovibrio sp.]|nr:DsrE family protein [Desulfovibrio sp.]MBI4960643.1 DsrE family protein [Desulfovibrio sp.]
MLHSMNVVVRKAPGEEAAVLGLRAAWAVMSSGGLDTQLVYMNDGVFNLLGVPGYIGDLLGRFIEEGGEVSVLRDSMVEFGLTEKDFIEGVKVVDKEDVADMVQDADATATF